MHLGDRETCICGMSCENAFDMSQTSCVDVMEQYDRLHVYVA